MNNQLLDTKIKAKILSVRSLTDYTFVIRFERKEGFNFSAGQYIIVRLPGSSESREYSIYSAEHDNYLELLIREVEDGNLSKILKNLKPGAFIELEGPFGFFVIDKSEMSRRMYYLIATGTGISPFHSYIRSHKKLNYKVLHGVRYASENYESYFYNPDQYVLCTTRDRNGDYHGRVTHYLKENPGQPDALYCLCGNSAMINDVFDILEEQGVPPENIRTEVYF